VLKKEVFQATVLAANEVPFSHAQNSILCMGKYWYFLSPEQLSEILLFQHSNELSRPKVIDIL